MKKLLSAVFIYLIVLPAVAQQPSPEIAIIPEPVSLLKKPGTFTLPKTITIRAGSSPEVDRVSDYLKEKLQKPTGYPVSVNNLATSSAIRLMLNKDADQALGAEGYQLSVSPKLILIKANHAAGLFYGVQTLLQLLPPQIENAAAVENVEWEIPCVEITDYPRFGWRGLMFDVARHFFTKEEVKKYIDNMARYKYNILHLGLTNDEGWRIEIKGLPRLTEVGAWNVKKVGYFGDFTPPGPNEPRNYGGFYTQDDIKELVQYAKERFVNILPEINVPGHSLAAVVSYPELSCTPEAKTYRVRSGEQIMDWSQGHPPIGLLDNTLCPANERVYQFIDTVITQVAKLFPFEYMHMGGDECPKNYWQKNDQVKALMKREGLKTMPEVQAYFTKRIDKLVQSKGKKMIGWDEILEGGISPTAAVMSWRGMTGGIEAAKKGHEVVMSPSTYTYIDYMQGDAAIEPKVYSSLRLNKSYEFEPVPAGVDPKYIKGGQANLWTEQIYNLRAAEYMTWPRAFAVAESVWSPKAKKNWNNFFGKVEKHFTRFNEAQIKYAPSVYEPIISASRAPDGQLMVELDTEVDGLDIHYSFDNSFPDQYYPKYTQPLIAPKDAFALKVITYKGNKPVGRMITVTTADLKSRLKK